MCVTVGRIRVAIVSGTAEGACYVYPKQAADNELISLREKARKVYPRPEKTKCLDITIPPSKGMAKIVIRGYVR